MMVFFFFFLKKFSESKGKMFLVGMLEQIIKGEKVDIMLRQIEG